MLTKDGFGILLVYGDPNFYQKNLVLKKKLGVYWFHHTH